MNIELSMVDYLDQTQARQLSYLLDAYASDSMVDNAPLSEAVQNSIAQELSRLPHAFSIIAYVDGFESFSTFACKAVVNIHGLVVIEKYRSKGLGQRIL